MRLTVHTRKFVLGAAAAVAVVAVGGAIAATQLAADPEAENKAVIADAAAELGVSPAALSTALRKAVAKRVDGAVEDGRLTEAQGDRLKRAIESGDAPLFGPNPGLGPHGPRGMGFARGFHPHPHGDLKAAAAYLDLTRAELASKLTRGTSLADVAKAEGKSVDGLVDTLVDEAKERLDQAVEDGRLTDAKRDEIAEQLTERTKAFVNGEFLHPHGGAFFRHGLPRGGP